MHTYTQKYLTLDTYIKTEKIMKLSHICKGAYQLK
jgi:hypothetical protein